MASARWRSWFLAALVAAGLFAAVAHWGEVRRFAALLREADPPWIALTKLFADQVLPSAGMGGNVLLVDQLRALNVPKGTAVAA